VRVTIADNGSGIAAEDMQRIFEPFYTTKKDTGTGLGLWVSSGIVRKHNGSIRVRRRLGGGSGTVFSIFLPYACEFSPVG
jgi:signal transduction histidine kinase